MSLRHFPSHRPSTPFGWRAAAALTVATAAFAAPAVAAGSNGDDGPIIGGNFLSVDPVAGRAWSLSANVGTLYDTNYRRTLVPQAAVRVTPRVDFGAGLPVGRQQLFVGGSVGRDVTINHPELSRGRYSLGGGLEWRLGTRCSGIVGAEASQRLTFASEQASVAGNVQNNNVVGASLGCRTPTGLGFGASLDRRTLTNDLAERKSYDLRSTVFSPNLSYGTPTVGQFSLTATFNDILYPNRFAPTVDGPVVEGVKIFQGRFGYQRSFGTRLQLALGVSYLKTSPRPDAVLGIVGNQLVTVPQTGFSGTGYDASITYQPSPRLGINFIASRNVNASPNVGAQVVVRTGFIADLSYQISQAISASVGGRIMHSQYVQSFATVESVARNSDNFRRIFASLDYSPVKLYSIALEVAHQQRRSDPAQFNYDGTTARLTLSVRLGRG